MHARSSGIENHWCRWVCHWLLGPRSHSTLVGNRINGMDLLFNITLNGTPASYRGLFCDSGLVGFVCKIHTHTNDVTNDSQYVTQTDPMDLIRLVHAVICSCTMFPCPFIDREVHYGCAQFHTEPFSFKVCTEMWQINVILQVLTRQKRDTCNVFWVEKLVGP